MAGLFDRIGGGVQNAVARGSVYNSTTGQYAPSNVRWQRMVQGGLSRLGGPQGALASMIWGKFTDRNTAAQRFDRGLQVAPNILPNGWRDGGVGQPGVSVGDVQTFPGMGGNMTPNFGSPSFTPQMFTGGNSNPLANLYAGMDARTDANVNTSLNNRLNSNEALIGQQLSGALNAPGGGWVSGGGGARGAFSTGGYASEAHRQASIDATQQSLQESRNQQRGVRQSHNYSF